ncbi:MAG: hypothetical protein EXS08_02200 [Planctomycetes bacterium]|nr:hypothetical protein [Planctomycetota bacterium]
MNAKLVACLVVLALLVAGVLYLVTGERDGAGRGLGERIARAQPVDGVDSPATVELGAAPASAPSSVAREASAPQPAAADVDPWRGELAGLTGRVVENNGTPVPGMRVALVEIDAGLLFDGGPIDAEEPRLELEETVTDNEGRFLLGGAHTSAFHGLGVDLGGPRATVRVIDHALPHRERTDIGDVVLAPFGVLTGRVVDESGAPLAGARVRCGPFPEEILRISPWEFRADSLIAVSLLAVGGDGQGIIELPGWMSNAVERLPVPTTESAADGSFRLEGVALASVVGGVDKRGYVGVPLGPLDLTSGEKDAGTLVLKRGRTVRGVVEDSSGEPVEGIEVHAGAELYPGTAAILQPCGPTDAEGRFELSGVAETGQVVAAARRSAHEPWSSTISARHEGLRIEVEGTVRLTVNVRDEQGQPLSGARLQLAPAHRLDRRQDFGAALIFLPKPRTPAGVFSEVEPGRYVLASLCAGLYDITARVAGLASAYRQAECRAETNEVTLTCSAGSSVELRVIDAVTKAPVVGARGSVLRVGAEGLTKLGVASTDAEGHAWLGPLPDLSAEAEMPGFMPLETMVLVQHPRYGDHSANLDLHVSPLVVELQSGGTLAGRVHWGGAVPTRLYMLTLEYRGADGFLGAFHLPRFSVTDLAGEFRVANLVPGEYRVELSERFLDQDPLGLMNGDFKPPTLSQETVQIKNGETSELVVDLSPTGRGATARLVGRVRVDGRGLEGAEVRVRGNEHLKVVTDSSGRFATEPFSIRGATWVAIEGEVALGSGPRQTTQLYEQSLQLVQDEVKEIELDLYPLTIHARVVDANSGEPVAEAEVTARAKDRGTATGKGVTGSTGEAEVLILEPGEYSLSASAEGFGGASSAVNVPAQGLVEATVLQLPRAVPCVGHVQVDAASEPRRGFAYLGVQGDGNSSSTGAMLQAPDYSFTLANLVPGKYRTRIYLGGQQGQEGSFELGPEGDENLVLVFVPGEPR